MKSVAVNRNNTETFGKRLRRDWNLNKWKYIMIIPVLIYLALFCYKPMYGLIIAFKERTIRLREELPVPHGRIPGLNGF